MKVKSLYQLAMIRTLKHRTFWPCRQNVAVSAAWQIGQSQGRGWLSSLAALLAARGALPGFWLWQVFVAERLSRGAVCGLLIVVASLLRSTGSKAHRLPREPCSWALQHRVSS